MSTVTLEDASAMVRPLLSKDFYGYSYFILLDIMLKWAKMCDIVDGVVYLHSFNPGVVHGDLKP
ncbi:hypothetical protein CPB86DRAFT_875802, partial [Serendipita vermifera]